MIPKKAFYFIRHGETEWNRQGLYMGSKDIPLNDTGIKQAKSATSLLAEESIDYIITSPLSRALQTAKIIAEAINKPINIVENLKERHLGAKEGTKVDKTILIEELITNTVRDEEKAVTFQNRVIFAMNHILDSFAGRGLIVSHGGVYSTLCHAMGWKVIELDNCATVYHTPTQEPMHSWSIYHLDSKKR